MANTYTNIVRSDGFGAQYQCIMFAVLYVCIHLNANFILTPTNFHEVYGSDAHLIHKNMGLHHLFESVEVTNGDVQSVGMTESYHFVENNIETCLQSETMAKIRRAYDIEHEHDPQPYSSDDPCVIHVAIHIRRPSNNPNVDIPSHLNGLDVKNMAIDVVAQHCPRFTVNGRYKHVMDVLRAKYEQQGKKCLFHIVSEGREEQFAELASDGNVIVHLNESVRDSFHKLVCADVLVICSSSFSYAAAFLGKGEVWYQPFWHRCADTWHPY